MDKLNKKREFEIKVIYQMIRIYCRHKHGYKNGLCPECLDLYNYAIKKIKMCPRMKEKTFCSNCKIHCYQKEYQDKIKKVMRYSGKFMLVYHPILTIKHLYYEMRDDN